MSHPTTAIAEYLGKKPSMRKIEQSLGGALKVEKFMQLAMNTIRRNEKLMQCTPESVLEACVQAAELQLFPGNNLGHAYLVPFWDGKRRAQICTYILGYKGMLALCHRSPKVLKVEAHLVFPEDTFSVSYGDGEHVMHAPEPWADRDPKRALGAYAVATLANGAKLHKVLNRAELDAARNRSKAKDYGPWVTDLGAMMLKTAVRRLAPWLPLEPQDAVAIAEDMESDLDPIRDEEPRETDAEVVEPENLVAELAGDVIDVETEEPAAGGTGVTEEQHNRLLDWVVSESVDPHLVRSHMRTCFGEEDIEKLSEEQAQELLDGIERGDFAPSPEEA